MRVHQNLTKIIGRGTAAGRRERFLRNFQHIRTCETESGAMWLVTVALEREKENAKQG